METQFSFMGDWFQIFITVTYILLKRQPDATIYSLLVILAKYGLLVKEWALLYQGIMNNVGLTD